jgi:O-acetylserine/cysteine efflux transporter
MSEAVRLRPRDVALGVLVPVIWGLGFVAAKAAIGHFPPILLMALRFCVTALALVWFVRPPVGRFGVIFAVAFVSAAIQYSLTFTGLKGLDASTAILVVQSEVPFLVLLGWAFLGERPSARKLVGVAVALGGVALISGVPSGDAALVSVLLVVSGAFMWAVGQAMIRKLCPDIGGFRLIAWVAVFAGPQLIAMSLIFEDDHARVLADADIVVWGAVVYMGLVMTALGYGVWYHLVGSYPISQVGPFLLLLPVSTVAGGVLLLGETLAPSVIAGGVLVLAGLTLVVFERGVARAAPRTK